MNVARRFRLRHRTPRAPLARLALLALSIHGALALCPEAALADSLAPAAPAPSMAPVPSDVAGRPSTASTRIVVVECRIRKGREQEFLDC